jgi:hypothetical protein
VWRDSFPIGLGGLAAIRDPRFPNVRLDDGWVIDPEPESNLDVEQAIGAKVHLALHAMPILATAQLVIIEPDQAAFVPDWEDIEQAFGYGQAATLPISPMFVDFESAAGTPVSWEAETWPYPFHLRGALLWHGEGELCGIPYGSVGGIHPFGGTDYQAWSRWIYLQSEQEPPGPGPGDNVAVGEDVISWVRFGDSICAHQAAISYHLMARVLRVLWAMETFGLKVASSTLPRPERRRAARAKHELAMVVPGLPRPAAEKEDEQAHVADGWEAMIDPCPFPSCHGRLIEAHTLWHEALSGYHDPGQFVLRINPLIQAMRNVTFALQKEISGRGLDDWYETWRSRMKDDPRMRWALQARNHVVKEGDLVAHSTARAWLAGDRIRSRPAEFPVAATASAAEIARSLHLPGIEETVRREGVLVVERRWVVDDLPEEELLDLLAHVFARLAELVADAHRQADASIRTCEKGLDDPCGGVEVHATGRLGCMAVSEHVRTSRRSLGDGAPISVGIETLRRPHLNIDEVRERYGPSIETNPEPELFAEAERLHGIARRMMETDACHITIAWLMRRGRTLSQLTLVAEDQRELYLAMERLASEARKLGADQLIVTAEGWEALVLPKDDPRHNLRPEAREDRSEVLLTHALQRGGTHRTWRTPLSRDAKGGAVLGETTTADWLPPRFAPVLQEWQSWPEAEAESTSDGDDDGDDS